MEKQTEVSNLTTVATVTDVPTATATGSPGPNEVLVDGEAAPHECGPDCKEHHGKSGKKLEPTAQDVARDTKSLKSSGYDRIKDRFNKAFVIENTKTGMIVELRAASSTHACTLIGWRPKNTKVVETRDIREATKEAT